MIVKTKTGRGFKGCIGYVHDKVTNGNGSVLLTNDISDYDKKYMVREMVEQSKTYEDSRSAGKFVWHTSISFPKNENVNDELMKDVANDYVNKMNLNKSQYIVVKHTDTEHPHFHIVANRVNSESKLVNDSFTKMRDYDFAREMEEKYKLEKIEGKNTSEKIVKNQFVKIENNREAFSKDVKETMHNSKDLKDFFKKLESKNITVGERGKEFKFKKGSTDNNKAYEYRGSTLSPELLKENINSYFENKRENSQQIEK